MLNMIRTVNDLELSEDYRAIRWMQDQRARIASHRGSRVCWKDNMKWHSRFTIYTGLPDVVGWQWHQQQQRVLIFSAGGRPCGAEVNRFLQQHRSRIRSGIPQKV
jgi:hypothetical protein